MKRQLATGVALVALPLALATQGAPLLAHAQTLAGAHVTLGACAFSSPHATGAGLVREADRSRSVAHGATLVYLHRHAPTRHAADVFMSGARGDHTGAPDYVDGGHMSGMQYVAVVALPKLGEVGKGALRLLLCVALRRRRRRYA